MSLNLYWGDLHCHCSISYGEGTVEQALARAREQLDFCSITGHAFWPDMPADRTRYGAVIDYHRSGFERLAGNWPRLLKALAEGSREGRFLALPSYEWHSLEYGDHNVYSAGPELPLRDAADLAGLRRVAEQSRAIVVPHHIGYSAGYRGIDWTHFDSGLSPVVEIHSLHGCSESDEAPYPMLHDMGPRHSGSTAVAGWRAGHRFGVIASTDHHGGYPGSHGDGRVAVWAEQLTRGSLWQAICERRVYAVTGDKIKLRLQVDGAEMGSEIRAAGKRRLSIDVQGSAALDRIELLKNDLVLRRYWPQAVEDAPPFRLRITWGWGRKDEPTSWLSKLTLEEGRIELVESCFSGQAVVAPPGVGGHTDVADQPDLPHAVLEQDSSSVTWRSVTTGNRSTRHPTTQALSLQIHAPLDALLRLETNGTAICYRLREVLRAARVTYLRGWLSEAIQVGPLDPLSACHLHAELDDVPQHACDRYRIRVAQQNGQWAWSSPIWTDR